MSSLFRYFFLKLCIMCVLAELAAITQAPVDVAQKAEVSTTFWCTATGSPVPTVDWLVDGRMLPTSSQEYELSVATNGTNVLRVVSPKADTLVTCRASNRWNTVTRNATLAVIGKTLGRAWTCRWMIFVKSKRRSKWTFRPHGLHQQNCVKTQIDRTYCVAWLCLPCAVGLSIQQIGSWVHLVLKPLFVLQWRIWRS